MEIHLIQYGQIAWRVSIQADAQASEASAARTSGVHPPLWSQDNYLSAETALADAQSVAAYLDVLEPAG